jgi:hypothetical protein
MLPFVMMATIMLMTATVIVDMHAAASSTSLARELASAMTARHLDAFAAKVPGTTDEYVAALLYPSVQLLVIGARHPTPAALDPLLAERKFHDLYEALHGTPLRDSILFVQDMGADGLRVDEKQSPDVVYQQVVHQTVLTGDVTAPQYRREIESIDPAYSKLLQALLDAVQAGSSPSSVATVR